MIPLNGFVELEDEGIFTKRIDEISDGVQGLGPPDLVIIEKRKKDKLLKYFHFCSGVCFKSSECFLKFYNKLKDKIPKFMGKARYEIAQVTLCIWNPFVGKDVRVIVSENGISNISMYNYRNERSDFDNGWDFLYFSSFLRAWYPHDPLFRAIFNLPATIYHPFRLEKPENITEKQLLFVSKQLPHSFDLAMSISAYLISSADPLEMFCTDYKKSLIYRIAIDNPKVIYSLLFYIPLSAKCIKSLLDYALYVYRNNSDEIMLASAIVDMAFHLDRIDRASIVVPFLVNTVWCSPLSCVSLAKLALKSSKPLESLMLLNACFFAREYEIEIPPLYDPKLPTQVSSHAPRCRPRTIEYEIIKSQFFGIMAKIQDVILLLCKTNSLSDLKRNLRDMLPKVSNKPVHFKGNTNRSVDSLAYNPVSKDFSDVDLYDPGICSDFTVPDFVRRFLISTRVNEVINSVITQDKIAFQSEKDICLNQPSARLAACTALSLGNYELFEKSMTYFSKKRRERPVHNLMNLKIQIMNTIKNVDSSVFTMFSKQYTCNEENSLAITKEIENGIQRLYRAYG